MGAVDCADCSVDFFTCALIATLILYSLYNLQFMPSDYSDYSLRLSNRLCLPQVNSRELVSE